MKTYHWNGEYWYERRDSLLKRLLVWLCWLGGWHTYRKLGTRAEFRRGMHMGRIRIFFHCITPVSFVGHRLTLFGWGWNLRLGSRWLVWCNARQRDGKPWLPRQCFLSVDGTPSNANTWLLGTPYEVRKAAARQQREAIEREARFTHA